MRPCPHVQAEVQHASASSREVFPCPDKVCLINTAACPFFSRAEGEIAPCSGTVHNGRIYAVFSLHTFSSHSWPTVRNKREDRWLTPELLLSLVPGKLCLVQLHGIKKNVQLYNQLNTDY